MAEQRQPFLFRLPWLSAMNIPRPTPEPQPPRPTPEIRAPPQPITSSPIQRPPFWLAGIAPTQTQPAPAPTTEPQPPTSYRSPTESRVASPAASPSRETQTRAASVPPEGLITSQPSSPSRETSQTRSPIQRPPFWLAGIAPTQTQPAPAPTTEPQPPTSYRSPTESRVASPAASPSRETQTRAASVPPEGLITSQPSSPSRETSQTRSPLRIATQSRAASMPPSPSRTASQTQLTIQVGVQPRSPSPSAPQSTGQLSSQLSSPSKELQPSTQDTSQPPLNLTSPPSSVTQEQELKPAATVQLLQEPQSKTQIKSDIVSESQIQSGANATFKPDSVPEQSTQASDLETVAADSTVAPEAQAAPKKLESVAEKADLPMAFLESEKNLKETEGKKEAEELLKEAKSEDEKKVALEFVKKEKSDGSADEEIGRTITKFIPGASGLETQSKSKELLGARIQTGGRKQEKHEIFEGKKPRATSVYDRKHIKTQCSTHQKDKSIVESHQKPAISNGERAPLHKEIREHVSKFVHKLTTGHPKLPMDDRPVNIITVAGENRGASMDLGSESSKKDGPVCILGGYKLKSDEISEATTDGEGSCRGKGPRDPTTKNNGAPRAYINSNAQSINNSILFSCSVDERKPGVHMVHSHNLAEPTKSTIEQETFETRKAEFSITPAENLTYQPTVRKRCVRGPFMKPSDSDPDNPEMPPRHGCRYNCGENSEDKDIKLL